MSLLNIPEADSRNWLFHACKKNQNKNVVNALKHSQDSKMMLIIKIKSNKNYAYFLLWPKGRNNIRSRVTKRVKIITIITVINGK